MQGLVLIFKRWKRNTVRWWEIVKELCQGLQQDGELGSQFSSVLMEMLGNGVSTEDCANRLRSQNGSAKTYINVSKPRISGCHAPIPSPPRNARSIPSIRSFSSSSAPHKSVENTFTTMIRDKIATTSHCL